jgi:hypothetical protein
VHCDAGSIADLRRVNINVQANTVQGDIAGINTETAGQIVQTVGNALQNPAQHKAWYERPLGIVLLAAVAALVAGGLIYYSGWH